MNIVMDNLECCGGDQQKLREELTSRLSLTNNMELSKSSEIMGLAFLADGTAQTKALYKREQT